MKQTLREHYDKRSFFFSTLLGRCRAILKIVVGDEGHEPEYPGRFRVIRIRPPPATLTANHCQIRHRTRYDTIELFLLYKKKQQTEPTQ